MPIVFAHRSAHSLRSSLRSSQFRFGWHTCPSTGGIRQNSSRTGSGWTEGTEGKLRTTTTTQGTKTWKGMSKAYALLATAAAAGFEKGRTATQHTHTHTHTHTHNTHMSPLQATGRRRLKLAKGNGRNQQRKQQCFEIKPTKQDYFCGCTHSNHYTAFFAI